jgi:hypothetical protein
MLWLLGVEVAPAIHLARHHEDHTHDANGAVVVEHQHGGHAHHHRVRRSHPTRPQLAIDEPRSAHHAAGFAHHAVALHDPPPPILEPIEVARVAIDVEHVLTDRPASSMLAEPKARGPPRT